MRFSPRAFGWCVFWVCVAIGVVTTRMVVVRLLAGMPAEEVYEALARDSLAFQYTLIGWFHTLVVASVLGWLASRWLRSDAG